MIDINGNKYNVIKIGEQYWTAENLKTTKYNDGSPIYFIDNKYIWSMADDFKTPAYCYYNDDTFNMQKYGALYNWYAVNTGRLAPKGWRVPTNDDWNKLENYLISTGNKIAKSMAATTDWASSRNSDVIGNDLSKNNKSGFSALPGGCRGNDGGFSSISVDGYWWAATEENAILAYHRNLYYYGESLCRYYDFSKGYGLSVRLVKEEEV